MFPLQVPERTLIYFSVIGHNRRNSASNSLQTVFPVRRPGIGAEIHPFFSACSPVLGGDIPHQSFVKAMFLFVPLKMHPPDQHRVITGGSQGMGDCRHIRRQHRIVIENV